MLGGSLNAIDEEKTFAELWMGTHKSGPSTIFVEGGVGGGLREYLIEKPSYISADEVENKQPLLYLFKVLSIAKALSIQAHPSKKRAEELFATRPNIYKDDNHKPEMACAISEFEALLGFNRIEDILTNLSPELRNLLVVDGGEKGKRALEELTKASASKVVEERKEALKVFFSAMMHSKDEHVAKRCGELVNRAAGANKTGTNLTELDLLALRLNEQFPNDIGIFCAYVLCYRKLQPGEAVFLGANEPHAYLSGECVEVMANSDNVIRAGLTPKYKDVLELEENLTYAEPGQENSFHPATLVRGIARDDRTVVFAPPDPQVNEFQLERTVLSGRETSPCLFPPSTYGSVILCLQGSGEAKWDQGMSRTSVSRGAIFYQPANTKVSFTGNVTLFRVTKKNAVVVE